MSHYSNTLAAGDTWEICESGRFFRLLSATGAVKVAFYRNGSLVSEIDNVQAGFWREALREIMGGGTDFDRIRITDKSGGSNALEVMIDLERIGYDRMSISGTVQMSAKNATPTQSAITVTNASALLLAANPNRRYVLIQNKDAAGIIYLKFDGAAATVANGLALGPGQSFESSASWVTAAQINAIGSIASNPNVVRIEGV